MGYALVDCGVYDDTGSLIVSVTDAGLAHEIIEWLDDREATVAAEALDLPDRQLAEQSHRYRGLDGEIGLSVTAVCGFPDEGKSDAFAYVARRLALEGLDHRVEWGYRADVGTRVHGHMEALRRGRDIEVRNDEGPFVDAGLAFLATDRIGPLMEAEAIVLGDGWGGRLDDLSETAVVDWKTGKARPLSEALQLNALNNGDFAIYDTTGALTGLEPFEPRRELLCVHLHDDATFTVTEHPTSPEWFEHFLRLKDAMQHHRQLAGAITGGSR
jgi:hypothetical protein